MNGGWVCFVWMASGITVATAVALSGISGAWCALYVILTYPLLLLALAWVSERPQP